MINPFVPPGHESSPDDSLDPEQHEPWYIDNVADHGTQFHLFKAALDDAARRHAPPSNPPPDVEAWTLRALKERGRLIVIEGPERSGKTTLIRRCIAELRRRQGLPLLLSTLDLSDVPPTRGGALLSADDMRNSVCKMAFERSGLDDDAIERGQAKLNDDGPQLAYEFLRRKLGPDRLVQVLLPPGQADSTDIANLQTYEQWTGQGMIFYAERTTTPNSRPMQPRATRSSAEPVLVLRLRPLQPGEAWEIVRRRTRDAAIDSSLPRVDESTMGQVEGLNRGDQKTVGWVVALFRRLYARRITGNSDFDGRNSIDYDEITDLLARLGPEEHL